jgi:small-conductance mechanosensitive channel
MTQAYGLSGAALLLGLAAHWLIGRAARRIPRWLALRRGMQPGLRPPGARSLALLGLALQGLLWIGVFVFVSQHVAMLGRVREVAWALVRMSFTMPLFAIGDRTYAVRELLALPLLLVGVWVAASMVVSLVRGRIFSVAGVEEGLQETLSALLRYALALVAALVVLQGFGVDVRALAILASVLGVGIGFGLQSIANNFVSGLLINLGRTIRPGDFVQVGEFSGTVRRVGPRSTEIETVDRVTVLLPNSRFLETEVVNWSHGDPTSRIHVPIGLDYGVDIALTRRALLEAAQGHPSVLREPRPEVQLREFGDSSIDFELLVWTRDPRRQSQLVSDLNYRIAESLRRHGLTIPFPQHDVHVSAPELERALEAWRRSLSPGSQADASADADRTAFARPAPAHPPEERADGPEDDQLDKLLDRLRGPGGVPIRDRRHLLTTHPSCFVGREAVDWLVRSEGVSRAEAVALGQRLVDLGVIHHVLDEHGFRDGHFFYRFREDDRG